MTISIDMSQLQKNMKSANYFYIAAKFQSLLKFILVKLKKIRDSFLETRERLAFKKLEIKAKKDFIIFQKNIRKILANH